MASAAAYELITELGDIAPAALEAAFFGLRRGTEAMEDVPIETTLDVKRLMESADLAHRIYRLASGQSTSNVAHATTDDERAERIRELRARLTQHDATSDVAQPEQ